MSERSETVKAQGHPEEAPQTIIQVRRRTSTKATLRPASLTLGKSGSIVEQPRISPLPPTPLTPSKRKALATDIVPRAPRHEKKRLIVKLRSVGRVSRRGVVGDLSISMNDEGTNAVANKPFPFLKLPGEIRNKIYNECRLMSDKQALVVHLPRTGTLRASSLRTRTAALYREPEDPEKERKRKPVVKEASQESHRPFVGLTQVCRQIRFEFYPWYVPSQEIGMDLTHTSKYVATFFNPSQPMCFAADDHSSRIGLHLPFKANITIAVAGKITPYEKQMGYVEILPLLDTWANSVRIEAGFGRYTYEGYQPQLDGEAKDLYRLYGRKVLPDRSCSQMNQEWRIVLRTRQLASVRIHRHPGTYPKPYFHLIWKYQHRTSWMTGVHSVVPEYINGQARQGSFLWLLGFDRMEYFQVRCGAETYPGQFSS